MILGSIEMEESIGVGIVAEWEYPWGEEIPG